MTGDRTIAAFLSAVASGNIAPGGGSTAALTGAAGAATCEKVCILADAGELEDARTQLHEHRMRLLELAAEDERLVAACFGGEEVSLGQSELRELTEVPLSIAEETAAVLATATAVVARGPENAVPDGIVGATIAHGAHDAAAFTVECNLPYLEDEDFVAQIDDRLADETDAASTDYATIRERGGDFTR